MKNCSSEMSQNESDVPVHENTGHMFSSITKPKHDDQLFAYLRIL